MEPGSGRCRRSIKYSTDARHPSFEARPRIVFHLDLGLNHSLTFVAKLIEKTTSCQDNSQLTSRDPDTIFSAYGGHC